MLGIHSLRSLSNGRPAIAVLLLIMLSCTSTQERHAHISGKLSDADGMKLVLQEMETHHIRLVDSVVPGPSCEFSFKPEIAEPGFWLIKAPTGKVLVLLLKPGDQVILSGSAVNFPNMVTLKGPEEAVMLDDFYRRTRINESKADSLEMIISERQDSSDFYQVTQRMDTLFRKIWDDQRDLEIDWIKAHPGSLGSLLVLNYAFGLSPVLRPQEDLPIFKMVDSALLITYPGNKHTQYHHQRVEAIRRNGGE